jgi:hypothetical protein
VEPGSYKNPINSYGINKLSWGKNFFPVKLSWINFESFSSATFSFCIKILRLMTSFTQPAILLVIFIGLKLWNRRSYVKLGSLDALRSSLTTLDALIEAAHTSSDSEPEIAQIIQQEQYYQPPPGPIYSPTSPEITSPNFGNGGVQNWENPKIVMPPTVTQLSNRDPQQQDPYPRHPSIPSRSTSPLAEYELSTSVSPPMSPMSELGHDSRTTSMVDGSLSAGDRVSGFSSYQWNPSGTGSAREDLERARARQRSYNSLAEESAVSR